MAQLFLREAARSDLVEAFRWYEERKAGLGFEFLSLVREKLRSIEQNPESYPVAVDDVRKAPLRRFPYVIYYVVFDHGISVIAVMHCRRSPQRWRRRR